MKNYLDKTMMFKLRCVIFKTYDSKNSSMLSVTSHCCF